MYKSVFLEERVELAASEMSVIRSADGIKQSLMEKLKRVEGKCNANGYVKPGSVQILARSMGAAENGKFTGNWIYDCKFVCEVLKPVAYDAKEPNAEASVLPTKVIKVNKMGAYAAFEEAIRILLPRDCHAGDPVFDALKEGDSVRVRMEKHRFQTNDPYIVGIGTLYKPGGEREEAVAADVDAATADVDADADEESAGVRETKSDA
jgi:DNA-directed RNA polymerase subunit E'/Rpb7